MKLAIERIIYYYVTVEDKHSKGYWLLEHFRQKGVKMTAFTAFPRGSARSQLDFVPEDYEKLLKAAKEVNVEPVGPKRAFLIKGEDSMDVLAELHRMLSSANINVLASNGVTDNSGRFGLILWVRPEDYEEAALALGV